jgi:hypothetical protein
VNETSGAESIGLLNVHKFEKGINMTKNNSISTSPKKKNVKDKQNGPNALPGWPGYRTRDGRSGYDPIDTRAEAAHTAGTILQKLFTGQVRNPFGLFLLGVFGLILITPLILAISEMLNGNLFSWDAWILLLIVGVAGFAVLINFIKNLIKTIN